MHDIADISQEECSKITKDMDIDLVKIRAAHKDRYAIKEGREIIDTSFAFTDKRYSDVSDQFEDTVLVLGLGFGCSVIAALEKKEVKKVVVYEIRQEVIDLFFIMNGEAYKKTSRLEIRCKDAMKIKETDKYKHVFINRHHITDPKDYPEYLKDMEILKKKFKNSIIHEISLT